MVLDARSLGLTGAVAHRFASIANLYITEPQVKMYWGWASLTSGPWIGIQAALRLGLECDWFSLHSALDALLRSPETIRAFWARYRGKAEFVATAGIEEFTNDHRLPSRSINNQMNEKSLKHNPSTSRERSII
jgi:hypothetical protein